MTVLNLQVGASTDDAQEDAAFGTMNLPRSTHSFGHGGFFGVHIGLRFTGVSSLSGATINTGTLTFRAASTDSGAFIGDWYAEDAEAPGTFTNSVNDITDRTRTTATCEGDGTDFGSWGNNQTKTFTGDGTNTIADIIQELADSYDPSTIVLIHLYTSGNGEREFDSYDGDSGNAPKLDIDYTAGSGDAILSPDPVTIPASVPVPTITGGPLTLSPDPVTIPFDTPAPSLIKGGVTLSPSPVTIPTSVPAPTITGGPLTLSPDPVEIPLVVPVAAISGTGGAISLSPAPVTIPLSVPAPTLTAGGVTLSPDPVAIPLSVPSPSISSTTTLSPDPVTIPFNVPAPSMSVGPVTISPDPVAIITVLPLAVITGGGGDVFKTWGNIIWTIDPNDYPSTADLLLRVTLMSSSAIVPAKARLFNITDGLEVPGSAVSTTSTTAEELTSGAMTLPSSSKSYRLEFGGETGGEFTCFGGGVIGDSD